MTHLAEVDPEGGPPQTKRPGGGAGRPPATKWAQLPECSSTAYEDQSKPQLKVGLIVRCTSSPPGYIRKPPDPRADNNSFYQIIHAYMRLEL
jgi:hypothetical protein